MAIKPGQTLLHYRIIEKIGKGGMGEVYAAEDTKLHRRIALKVLPEDVAADPDRQARFEREARAVAALSHPNIVTLHSVEESNGVHFITMELVEGKTLTELIPRQGFALNRLLKIAIPLADAVSRAHREGITHRDLKPDNVMIDSEDRLRVLDFGLAKLHDPSGSEDETEALTEAAGTEEGKILGTVAYMSPEQAEGKAVDPRSDVFSLGTILYEMATGERPFSGETSMSTISSILRDEPTAITEINRALPRYLGRIVRRCLSKDPDRRYQTALDLRNELEQLNAEIDSGELVAGPRPTARQPRRWIPLGIFAAAAVAGIIGVFAIRAWRQPDPPAAVYTSRPITSTIEYEADLNWSPEGEFIAFARMTSGSLDLMVQPVSGGEAVVRADGPGDETTPRWSPDGKYLAYISSSEPGSFIFLVPPHGGTPRRLIDTNINALDIDTLAQAMGDRPWSPDSKTLMVSRLSDSGQLAVFRVDRDNGDVEQLTFPPLGSDDLFASHSFDGERLVFQRRTNGRGALLTMPAAGGDSKVLLADEFDNLSPAWRPDNRLVLYRSNRGGGNVNIWEIDVKTGISRQLTFETKGVWAFSVSADDRIAYLPYWHDTFLFTINAETGEKRQLTSHTNDNFGARFSPDDRTIAYHSTRTGDSEVWLYHMDGRPETRVTDDPAWDLYPEWSPDGQRLIFVSNREGPFKIFIADRDGGNVRRLIDQPISLRSPLPVNGTLVARWSPDGERIAYVVTGDEADSLWTVRPDGEGALKVLENVTGFDWYPDSRHAVFTRQAGSESELIVVDLETGREHTLFVGPIMEMDVAPDGGSVVFCYGRGHMGMGVTLLRFEQQPDPDGLPRAVGEPEYLVPAEGTWHTHNGGWSSDSKSLVYTKDTDYADIYELVAGR